jgi:hypothetical protein
MKFPNTRYLGKKQWVNLEDYPLYVRFRGKLYLFTIKAAFLYDKVSTFRLASFITGVERSGPGDIMTLHHDAGYVMKGEMSSDSQIMTCEVFDKVRGFIPFNGKFSRKDIDDMMAIIMEDTNSYFFGEFTPSQISIHYWAVRLGGWTKWRKEKRPENDYLYDLTKLKK